MDAERWVKCQFCQQTYAAGKGNRCSLCGKEGGLETAPPPPSVPSGRESWATPSGPDGGTALGVGCLGILAGAVLGMAIAFALPSDSAKPVQDDQATNECGLGAGVAGLLNIIGRAAAGAVVGGVVGVIISLVLLVRMTRLTSMPPTTGNPTAVGQGEELAVASGGGDEEDSPTTKATRGGTRGQT